MLAHNILERFTRFTDENGRMSYVFNDLPYSRLEIAHFEDNYYTNTKEDFYNTKGAFEYLKELIESCPENGIADLHYNHVYNEDLDNITEGIEISKNITINGNGHVIDALHKTGIFKINGCNVVLKNIIFKNAGSSGFGAIEANSSKITVLNCSFINNTAQSGGAISLNGSDATVGDSTFANNTADYGAAIYLLGGKNVISNCSFMNNVANSNGVIYGQANTSISNCTFESDNSDIYADGNADLINNVIHMRLA